MPTYLDFEAPLAELEGKIAELRALATGDKTVSITDEVKGLENPTSEILSRWLWDHLAPALPQIERVTVFETNDARCEYEGH